MRRAPQLTYDQLIIAAKELLLTYKSEQLKRDQSRYFQMFRPYTASVRHEHLAQFLGCLAGSLERFNSRDQVMTNACKNTLCDAFRFVIKMLKDSNESSSVLAACCLSSLNKDVRDLPNLLNNDYKALLKHLEWFFSMKDSGSLHKTISNEELLKLVKTYDDEVMGKRNKEEQELRLKNYSEAEGFVYLK